MGTVACGTVSARWARQLRAGGRTDQHRASNRRYYAKLKKRATVSRIAAAADVRRLVYVPPSGLIAWSLLGSRVIR